MVMTNITDAVRAEYLRYKGLAAAAIDQLSEHELPAQGPDGGNSVAVICWHVSANMRSRFTKFLTSDGEKSWRNREEEFQARTVTQKALLTKWNEGWDALLGTLATLTDEDLQFSVTIRGQPIRVREPLHRSLAHLSYHVGQIVYGAKAARGKDWRYLSIPRGKSDAINQALAAGARRP
ncbi:MAG: DUF1572 domain-containing protein [Gemmatimonadaceae bacterium]